MCNKFESSNQNLLLIFRSRIAMVVVACAVAVAHSLALSIKNKELATAHIYCTYIVDITEFFVANYFHFGLLNC